MKKILSFLFLLFISRIFTQVSFKEFKQTSDASQKLTQAQALWEYYLRNNTDSLKYLAIETFNFASDKKSESLKYFSKKILGCYLVRIGNFIEGESELKAALYHHQKKEDFSNITEDLNELGISNFLKGDYHSAESFFKLSLASGKESPNETHRFLAELNLAKTYDKLDLKEKAKAIASHYLKESLRLQKFESVSNAYGILGDIALNEKKLNLAEEYLNKSLSSIKSNSNLGSTAQINSNLGAFYATTGNVEKAKLNFNRALKLRVMSKNQKGILEAYYNLGSVEYNENNYEAAEKFFLKGLALAKEYKLLTDQIDFLELLVEIQKEKKDKDKEIEYYRLFIDVKSQQAEFLLKNNEEQENLIEYFQENDNKSSTEIEHPSNFWSGFLVGIGSLLILLFILLFFKAKLISRENQRYDD
ncbi:MAG: tetratricopeptide repeat protein [Bacteroidetes bacterium]|nr:tetratricopeptide repeat protein [Bacteroidota bacterium]